MSKYNKFRFILSGSVFAHRNQERVRTSDTVFTWEVHGFTDLLWINADAAYFTTSWALSSAVGVTFADDGVGVTSAVEAVCIHPLVRHRRNIHVCIMAACFLHVTIHLRSQGCLWIHESLMWFSAETKEKMTKMKWNTFYVCSSVQFSVEFNKS